MGDKLTFNGSTLTVNGTINANAGNFSGNITSTATISGGTISGGTISGGLISGGSINIGNGRFVVGSDGTMSATGAQINGTITANAGNIGGWNIATDGLGYISGDGVRGVKLNSARGALEVSTNGQVSVDINSNQFLTDLTAGTSVWNGLLVLNAGNYLGNGQYNYGATGTPGFSLTAGETYQFSMGTGYIPPVYVSGDDYNQITYGIIVSNNPTPDAGNQLYGVFGSKYRFGAGSLQPTGLNGSFTATTSGTHYIRPVFIAYSYSESTNPFTGEVTYNPQLVNLSSDFYYYGANIVRSTQKTEIVGGGIQVVKDIDTYFKVDRNASGTNVDPFVYAQGASIKFAGDTIGYSNSFTAERFSGVSLSTQNSSLTLGDSGATSLIDNKEPASSAIRITSNGYIRLEPNGPGGYFAYVGYSNNANLQIKVANGTNPSDERVKTEIETLEDGSIEKIKELNLKKFRYRDSETGDGIGHTKIGVIAQELQTTSLNGLVVDETNGVQLSVDYDSLLGHALKAIQELTIKVETLEAKLSGSI